jgi:TRAP-type transport system small permease protein
MSLRRLEALAAKISKYIALIGIIGLVMLCCATIADVLGRWLFNSPIKGVRDTYILFMGIIIASSLPLAIAERGNVCMRFMDSFLSFRVQKALEAFGGLMLMAVIGVAAWKVWVYANDLARAHETTWLIGWQVAPWWRLCACILAYCIPVAMILFIEDIKSMITGKKQSGPTLALFEDSKGNE